MLAAVWACKRYQAFLEDKPFILRTDSNVLQWLDKVKDGRTKLTRYSLLLQEFNFEIQHCLSRENQLPDYLCWNPIETPPEPVDEERLAPPEATPAVEDQSRPM